MELECLAEPFSFKRNKAKAHVNETDFSENSPGTLSGLWLSFQEEFFDAVESDTKGFFLSFLGLLGIIK